MHRLKITLLDALVHGEGVEAEAATAALEAVSRAGEADDPVALYRAARDLLRERHPASDARSLHPSRPPISVHREPPKRRGTARDTPVAKRPK